MIDKCYGKINLSLNITKRREDGYHEMESIMVPLKFFDLLEINKALKDEYECNIKQLRFDDSNTVVKMINAVREEYGIEDHFKVKLDKIIPSQAGLGGGSADGAGVLRIMKKMYNLNLNEEDERRLCNKVGSDVFFTYYNKPALVEGIGDQLEFFDIKDKYYCLLVKPRKGVSTKLCYNSLDLNTCDHPDVFEIQKRLINGDDIDGLLGNSLKEPAVKLCPDILEAISRLEKEGAKLIEMSGSGSTVFCLSKNKEEILSLYKNMKKYKYLLRFTEFL